MGAAVTGHRWIGRAPGSTHGSENIKTTATRVRHASAGDATKATANKRRADPPDGRQWMATEHGWMVAMAAASFICGKDKPPSITPKPLTRAVE